MLEATAKEITASTGHEVIPVQMDIRDPAAVAAALDACEAKAGACPDIVVNNVVVAELVRTISEKIREGASISGPLQNNAKGCYLLFSLYLFMRSSAC